jgi:multidrug efflux system membrane fusion protein
VKIPKSSILLAAATLAVTACGKHETSAAGEAPRVQARFAQAERLAQADTTGVAGTVAADQTAAVSSRVMATVTAVPVRLGDAVAAGQTLVSIDPTTAQGQVAQAEGALAQARAALTLAQRNYERFQALARTQAASELELDLARMQYEQAQGAVQQGQGAVEAASSVARESRVVAPFAGRVAQRLVEVGDLAAPGRPLIVLESQVGRRMVLSVPEGLVAAAALEIGDAVPVTLDAQPELGELAGKVAEVSPGPDPVSHSYTVKLELAGVDVAAGAAGRAWLPVGRREAVVVPAEALVQSGGLTLVVVRDPDGRAQSRVVTLGARRADGRIEVLSGLAGGETLALGLPAAPPAGALLEETHS